MNEPECEHGVRMVPHNGNCTICCPSDLALQLELDATRDKLKVAEAKVDAATGVAREFTEVLRKALNAPPAPEEE